MVMHMRMVLLLLVALISAPLVASCSAQPDPRPECRNEVPARGYLVVADLTFPVGPVVLNASERKVTIMWETDTACSGWVQFGEATQGLDQRADSLTNGTIHHARLTDLQPDTHYEYQVSACGLQTSVLDFWTAPPAGTAVRFTVWGDSRTRPNVSAMVVEAMGAEHPLFTIHTGDVVTDGDDYNQWRDEYFEPLRPLGHHVPTFVAIGNHEGNAQAFYDYSDLELPPTLADHRQFGSHYSFTYGNIFFLMVDSNNPYFLLAGAEIDSAVTEWIAEQLISPAALNARWRIAAAHHPAWSESWSPGNCSYVGTPTVANWFIPLLAENDFHLYFTGHTHSYERAEYEGLVHIISGGGGATLDEWCQDLPQTSVYHRAIHYTLVEAGCDELRITAITVPDGTVLDEVVLD
jgi:Calcineurin-like phosphoesterase/Purple acid Phosphatase, N-terminal domain